MGEVKFRKGFKIGQNQAPAETKKGKKKMQSKTSMRRRKKQKENKFKGTMPLVLTEGDLDETEEKLQQVTVDSWNKTEDLYDTLLIGVEQSIAKLKILVQTSRQLA